MTDEQSVTKKYYGKYRGTVVNNLDPLFSARIQATVPAVTGLIPTTWATPCLPVAGLAEGMYAVPPIGAGVWIEYEEGDMQKPIWTGCYVGTPADVPPIAHAAIPPGVSGYAIGTMLQNNIVVSDVPGPTGGIMLKSTTGATIIVNDTGIYLQNGKGAAITMVGPTVDVNLGALTIT